MKVKVMYGSPKCRVSMLFLLRPADVLFIDVVMMCNL